MFQRAGMVDLPPWACCLMVQDGYLGARCQVKGTKILQLLF